MTSASNTGGAPAFDAALCVFATGRYVEFLPNLATTVRRHFLPGKTVQIVVFTDHTDPSDWADLLVSTPHLPWPLGTLLRYHFLWAARDVLLRYRHIFMCDADMRFVGEIGDEILSARTATLGQCNAAQSLRTLPYCRIANSAATIPIGAGAHYYVGGFQGGESQSYLADCAAIAGMIDADLRKGIIATWHDESYWNRYLCDHPPTKALCSEYCLNEQEVNPRTKIIALIKDHNAYRAWSPKC